MSKVHRVNSSNALAKVLNNAKGGDVILLEPSSEPYVYLWTNNRKSNLASLSSEIVIKSADPNNPAVFGALELRRAQNVTIDNVIFDRGDFNVRDNPSFDLTIHESKNITIKNSTFFGGAPESYVFNEKDFVKSAVVVNNSENIKVLNNDISHYKFLVSIGNSSHNVTVEGNSLTFAQDDFIRIRNDTSNISIVSNSLSNPIGNKILHQDFIHLWTDNSRDQGVRGLLIKGNDFLSGDDDHQVIYIQNKMYDQTKDAAFMHTGIVIEDNVIFNGSRRGISVTNSHETIIRNNTLIMDDHKPDAASTPRMPIIELIGEGSALIHNNVSGGFVISDGVKAILKDNLVTQGSVDTAPLAQSSLFANVKMVADVSIHDLIALPGTELYKANGAIYGSQRLDWRSYDGVVMRLDGHVDGYVNKVSVAAMAGGLAPSLTNAKVSWDFGDGRKATGLNVDHYYAKPGLYTVTMTAVYPDGRTEIRKATAQVENPVLLDLDFRARSAFDASGWDVTVTNFDAKRFLYDPVSERHVYDIGAGGMTISGMNALSGRGDFSFSFDLRMSGEAASGHGRIASVRGLMAVDVLRNGDLSVRINDVTGEAVTVVGGQNMLRTTDWTTLKIDYFLSDGMMSVWLDDTLVGTAPVTSAAGIVTGNMALGKSNGLSFGALLADVRMETRFADPKKVNDKPAESDQPSIPDAAPGGGADGVPDGGGSAPAGRVALIDLDIRKDSVADVTSRTESIKRVEKDELTWSAAADQFVFDVSGDGLALSGVSHLFGREDLSLSFMLQAQDGSDFWGRLATLRGFLVVDVTRDGALMVRMHGAENDVYEVWGDASGLRGDGIRELAIDYSLARGEMSVHIDGALIGSVAVDQATGFGAANMSIGNAFGRSLPVHLIDFVATTTQADDWF